MFFRFLRFFDLDRRNKRLSDRNRGRLFCFDGSHLPPVRIRGVPVSSPRHACRQSRQRHYIIAFFPAQERRRKEVFSSRLKGRGCMSTRFIPKEKLSKKARRELNAARRTLWVVSPISKKVESKKVYNRKKSARLYRDDTGRIFSFPIHFRFTLSKILRFSPRPACPYHTSFAASRGSC